MGGARADPSVLVPHRDHGAVRKGEPGNGEGAVECCLGNAGLIDGEAAGRVLHLAHLARLCRTRARRPRERLVLHEGRCPRAFSLLGHLQTLPQVLVRALAPATFSRAALAHVRLLVPRPLFRLASRRGLAPWRSKVLGKLESHQPAQEGPRAVAARGRLLVLLLVLGFNVCGDRALEPGLPSTPGTMRHLRVSAAAQLAGAGGSVEKNLTNQIPSPLGHGWGKHRPRPSRGIVATRIFSADTQAASRRGVPSPGPALAAPAQPPLRRPLPRRLRGGGCRRRCELRLDALEVQGLQHLPRAGRPLRQFPASCRDPAARRHAPLGCAECARGA